MIGVLKKIDHKVSGIPGRTLTKIIPDGFTVDVRPVFVHNIPNESQDCHIKSEYFSDGNPWFSGKNFGCIIIIITMRNLWYICLSESCNNTTRADE